MEFDAVLLPPRRAESVARLLARAIKLIVDADWPPRAVTMRVLDAYGREVHSERKGDVKR